MSTNTVITVKFSGMFGGYSLVRSTNIQFSSYKRGTGSAFLCDQNLSSCSPNSRPQNVSSYTVTSQGLRFVMRPFLLIHEKWVVCCIKNATINGMLPN